MRYLVRHFPNAYRLNGRPAECDLAFDLQAKVGINRQGLQFLFLRRRWSMCLLRGVSISLPYILLLQREAAFDRAAIQILDKVIPLLKFKLIDC